MTFSTMTRRCGLIAACVALTAGCDRIGSPFDALDNKRSGPDEFSVIARAPLRMPGTRDLPQPSPGSASPLEPNPQAAAVAALTGRTTLGTAPTAGGISQGEQALLTSANAASSSGEIRTQLDREAIEAEASKEYQTPSLIELFSGERNEIDTDNVIDPNSESRRLQTAGTITPVNPFEEVPVEPRARDTGDEFTTRSSDRRPTNRLPQRDTNTGTAEEATTE